MVATTGCDNCFDQSVVSLVTFWHFPSVISVFLEGQVSDTNSN